MGPHHHGGPRRVLLPDLGDELTAALGHVEELLLEVQAWEEEDPDTAWPAPLAGGAALGAVRRVWDAVAPGQGDRAIREGLTGRLLAPAGAVTLPGASTAAPGGEYEHIPLRVVTVDQADIDMLDSVAQAFGDPHAPAHVTEALAAATETAYGANSEYDRTVLAATAARITGLLTLAPDAGTELLTALVTAAGPAEDITLDADGEAAYAAYARRANAMWAWSGSLSLYLY